MSAEEGKFYSASKSAVEGAGGFHQPRWIKFDKPPGMAAEPDGLNYASICLDARDPRRFPGTILDVKILWKPDGSVSVWLLVSAVP